MCDWLPKEIQEIVKQHVWLANPMSDPMFKDTDMVRKYGDHERKLRACGHDTQEFNAAIERARVAIRELDHMNEFMYERFKRDPFPFTKEVSAKQGLGARLVKVNEENAQRIKEMRQFNAAGTPAGTDFDAWADKKAQAIAEENAFGWEKTEVKELLMREPDAYERAMDEFVYTGSMKALKALLHDEQERTQAPS